MTTKLSEIKLKTDELGEEEDRPLIPEEEGIEGDDPLFPHEEDGEDDGFEGFDDGRNLE